MKSSRLLLVFVQTILCERIANPPLKVVVEQIKNTVYEIFSHQSLTLTYEEYGGVYSLDLWRIDKRGNQIKQQQVDQDFNFSLDKLHQAGCFPRQRQLDVIKYKEFTWDSQENQGGDTNIPMFQDMVVFQDSGIVILVRDDFKVFALQFQADLNLENSQLDYLWSADLRIYLDDDPENTPNRKEFYLTCTVKDICYVFTDTQVGYFHVKSKGDFNMTTIKYQESKQIHAVQYSKAHSVIYVAQEQAGVAVFSINDDGSIEQISTLDLLSFGQEVIDVRDVNVNTEGTQLYVLDYLSGLYVFDVKSPVQYHRRPFVVEIHRGHAFGFYEQTFFIVAQTSYYIDFVVEIFINFETGQYYFNQLYKSDMLVYDIQVHQHWAMIIGLDAHRVVYHSVYHRFIVEDERQFYFGDYDLMKIESFQTYFNGDDQSTILFGLSDDDVRLFRVKTTNPSVVCWNNSDSEYDYILKMNATDCIGKSQRNDNSQFSQCVIRHPFKFKTVQVLVDHDHITFVYAFIIGVMYFNYFILSGSILLALIICLACVLKQRSRYRQLEQEYGTQFDEEK